MTIQYKSLASIEKSGTSTSYGIRPSSTGLSRLYRGGAKRAVDIIFTVAILPLLILPLLIVAALIACDGGRPFYQQVRVGKNGKLFKMWKLRTMVPDAEARLAEHLASNPIRRIEWDRRQKLQDDPRITPIGRFLRRSSFDELPQLWNVLRGDMSLIGPRPMLPEQQAIYPGTAYYKLRPGLSGFWQISDRNHSSFARRSWFDSEYDAALSFTTDVKVMIRTVSVVLRGTGW